MTKVPNMLTVNFISCYGSPAFNLNAQLISRPATTTVVRVKGRSLERIGLWWETLAIVDTSLPLWHKDYVVAHCDDEYILKLMQVEPMGQFLMPLDDTLLPIKLSGESDATIYGKATHTINCYEPLSEYSLFDEEVDLNAALIPNPATTYMAKIFGENLYHLGIYSGAIALVNKECDYLHGDLVVVWVDNSFQIMMVCSSTGDLSIVSLSGDNENVISTGNDNVSLWGKITHVINCYHS